MSFKKVLKRIFFPHKIKVTGNKNIFSKKDFRKCDLIITGNNNTVEIHPKSNIKGTIYIFGHDNHIRLGKIEGLFNLCVGVKDCNTHHSSVSIGDNTFSNGLSISILEDNSHVSIGSECLFSSNITIMASDTHCVLDKNGTLLNYGKSIEIGNHVWVGMDVKITKNTQISDNSIIGWGSIITKKFTAPNVIIAGAPAKIVKRDITWDKRRPDQYLAEQKGK